MEKVFIKFNDILDRCDPLLDCEFILYLSLRLFMILKDMEAKQNPDLFRRLTKLTRLTVKLQYNSSSVDAELEKNFTSMQIDQNIKFCKEVYDIYQEAIDLNKMVIDYTPILSNLHDCI